MTRRVGLIIPSSNRMVEEEMVRFYPEGVAAHVARLRMTGPHRMPLEALLGQIETAASHLADARCEVVSFHCTVNSMSEGEEGEKRIADALARGKVGRARTTAGAVRAAIAALSAERIALVAPYDRGQVEEEVAFLESLGCTVVSARGYDLRNSDEYCATPSHLWRDRLIEAGSPGIDAYFLSCANVRALGEIAAVEAALGRPLLTSNQVVIWDGLRALGLKGESRILGALFEKGGDPDA